MPKTTLAGSFPKLGYETKRQPLVSRRRFAARLARAVAFWLVLTIGGLAVGIAGYMLSEGMGPVDAFVNAAMILSGMGPVGEFKSSGGKIFAGLYAIFSGLLIVIATGFILAPIMHRVLHAFHVEEGKEKDE